MFPNVSKKTLARGVDGWGLTNPIFSGIFFNLTRPLSLGRFHDFSGDSFTVGATYFGDAFKVSTGD